jgi:predicted pyridoxine 5'-phosphate oxidase superfamily flavin-nucleotide-binding protein
MPYGFLDIAATPSVKAAQETNGSAGFWSDFHGERAFDRFTEAEVAFITERDSFYMATVGENGWPYVQHRGGPPGFLRVLNETTLAFADFGGNRQYISVGNLSANNRASLILVDYQARRRLKIYARVEVRDLSTDLELASQVATPGYRAKIERALLLRLQAFDWNCPQHITPRRG